MPRYPGPKVVKERVTPLLLAKVVISSTSAMGDELVVVSGLLLEVDWWRGMGEAAWWRLLPARAALVLLRGVVLVWT